MLYLAAASAAGEHVVDPDLDLRHAAAAVVGGGGDEVGSVADVPAVGDAGDADRDDVDRDQPEDAPHRLGLAEARGRPARARSR